MTPEEAGLLRRVRMQLALWSGGITLVLLLLLGGVVYVAVDRSLSNSGTAQLVSQANAITRWATRAATSCQRPASSSVGRGRGR